MSFRAICLCLLVTVPANLGACAGDEPGVVSGGNAGTSLAGSGGSDPSGAGTAGAGVSGAQAQGPGGASGGGGSGVGGSGAGGNVASSPFEPLEADDMLMVDAKEGYGSALFERSDGAWVVVFERFSFETAVESSLRVAVSVDHQTFEPAMPLPGVPSVPFAAGPVRLVLGGQSYLYFSGGTYGGAVAGHRLTFDGTSFSALATVQVDEPSLDAMGWPRPIEGLDGRLVLAYEHYPLGKLRVALGGTDGLQFGAPTSLGSGVQGRLGSFATGQLVYSNQDGKEGPQKAFVRLSSDGLTWSAPAALSASSNVHDTHPFRRSDGGVDVYYIAAGDEGFAIWRRAVSPDGQLGVEQRVTAATAGSFTQPHPHRLEDGRIVLTFAEQLTSAEDTRTRAAVLSTDAPTAPL